LRCRQQQQLLLTMRSCQHRVTRASLLSAAASCSNQAPTETSATTGSTSATDVDSQRVLDCIRLLQWVTSPYRPSVHRPASPTVNDQSNRPRTNEGPGRPPAWLPASDAPGGCATLRRRTSVMRCPLGCSLACSVGRSVGRHSIKWRRCARAGSVTDEKTKKR